MESKKMHDELNLNDPKLKSILEGTVKLFYEFGIRNLNMDDISRKLGISKKTLYQYFKSKEDLIEKLFYFDEMKWESKFAEIRLKKLNAIDILIQVSLMVFDELEKLNPQLKFELKKYYEPIFNDFMDKKHKHIFNQISKNIKKGIKERLYRSDVNIELVAGLYVKNLVDMHSKDYSFFENITFEQVFEVMFENHIRAISTPEGIAYFEKRKSEITPLYNK
ncbi:MAG TPA: TetR/AcrR family transcriptional regulator [Draconibacterium sp.]|nr:TetR/AcrR family transcriptional regulator [Draconibacterium sp.]